MKKVLICFLVLISVLCVVTSAKTVVSEYEGFTCTWTDGNVYIKGEGKLPEKIVFYMFQPEYGEEHLVINENDEWKYNRVELSEGITEIPGLNFSVSVNYSAIFGELVIPSTVKSIDRYALFNVEKVTVSHDNTVYASHNGALYSKDMSTFIALPRLHTSKSLIIPDGVTRLEDNCAYKAMNLESVVIPEGVIEIPGAAFSDTKKLNYVKIPSTVKTIAPYAFSNSELVELSIPDGVEVIPTWSFPGNPIERIYIPKSVKKIEAAGVDTSKLKFVYYGGTAEDWKEIEIKNIYTHSSNDFSEAVFRYNATGLPETAETLKVEPLNDKYPSGYLNDDKTVAWYVDENYILHVHGYGKTEDVSDYGAYKKWTPYIEDKTSYHLNGLIVHESITEIVSFAFDTFTYDTIELPTTIKKIGFGAFYSVFCDKIVVKSCPQLKNYTFPRMNVKEFILPSNLVTIEPNCFVGTSGVTSLTFPISIKSIAPQSLPSSLTDIYYEGSEKDWQKVSKPSNWGNVKIHFMAPSFFVDVPQSHWAHDYIKALYDKEIIGGTSPTTYEPEGTLTWGQALKLLLASCGHGNLVATRSHWASGFLDYAKFRQWVGPKEINDAQLDDKITRLRFCQLAAGVKMIVAQPEANPFTDTDDVMVLALYNAGIIGGTSATEFSPDQYLTRAQIAKIIYLLNQYK